MTTRSASSAYSGGQKRPMVPRNGTEAGTQIRHAIWKVAGRLTAKGAARDRQLVTAIRANYPKVAAGIPDIALIAAARPLAEQECSWCVLTAEAEKRAESPPRPSPTLNALLGSRCSRCQVLHRSLAIVDRERAHVAQVVASGLQPVAAGRLRTPEAIADYSRRLQRLDAAKLPPPPGPRSQLLPEGPPVTVTRTRLDSPPEPVYQSAPLDPKVETRQHQDVLRVLGYFAARAGQWCTIAQIVAGTRLPIGRAYDALDYLVASEVLIKHNEHLTRAGVTTPAWIRRDPPSDRE